MAWSVVATACLCSSQFVVESERSGRLELSLEVSSRVERCGAVSSSDELSADEDARHGATGGDLAQVILDGVAVVALVKLDHLKTRSGSSSSNRSSGEGDAHVTQPDATMSADLDPLSPSLPPSIVACSHDGRAPVALSLGHQRSGGIALRGSSGWLRCPERIVHAPCTSSVPHTARTHSWPWCSTCAAADREKRRRAIRQNSQRWMILRSVRSNRRAQADLRLSA